MELILLYKGKFITNKILLSGDKERFNSDNPNVMYSANIMMKLFEYFFDLDISEYTIRDVIRDGEEITVSLTEKDYIKIKRDQKINILLK